jgi:hypothetical protein
MIQLKYGNRKWMLLMVLSVIGLFMLASCAAIQQQQAYHRLVMKGSIIHTSDTDVYLCIGKKDGASIDQELDVYKITYTGQPKTPTFKKEKTGKVKITEILDEHFATAVIISGTAEKNDIVELAF